MSERARDDVRRVIRIGCVSYLNSKPLIYGLEKCADVELKLEVPAKLLGGLREGRFDVGLLPVIDYQRMEGLRIVPSGGIGSNGETLTVRIFSRVAVREIRTLACDTESHTSVGLARVILAERYSIRPEFMELSDRSAAGADAVLLIGDKVITDPPKGLRNELDLGAEWKAMTGLPFLFAVWMARDGIELGDVPRRLEQAKRAGLANVKEIVERDAAARGWPAAVAMRYLTAHLNFDVGPKQIEAMELFWELAAKHGVIEGAVRELRVYG